MATEPYAEALLAGRQEALERMLQTKAGQEVLRFEAAYRELTGQEPPPWYPLRNAGSAAMATAEVTAVDSGRKRRGPRNGSVRSTVKEIILSAPRVWTYDEIATEMEMLGMEARESSGKPKTTIRGAAFHLVNDGEAMRGPGRSTIYATEHREQVERQLDRGRGVIPFSQSRPDAREVM